MIALPHHAYWYPLGGSSNTSNPVVSPMDSHCHDKASKDFKGNVFERVKMQAVMTKVLSFVCYTTYFYINVVLSLGSTKIKLNKAMMITDNETAIDFCRVRKGSCEIKKIKKTFHQNTIWTRNANSLPSNEPEWIKLLCPGFLVREEAGTQSADHLPHFESSCGPVCCSPSPFPSCLSTVSSLKTA